MLNNDLRRLANPPREPLLGERARWLWFVAVNAVILGGMYGLIWAGLAALGSGPGTNLYVDVGIASTCAYATGRYAERYRRQMVPGTVTRLPLRLGWWLHGVGWCPNEVILDHARARASTKEHQDG